MSGGPRGAQNKGSNPTIAGCPLGSLCTTLYPTFAKRTSPLGNRGPVKLVYKPLEGFVEKPGTTYTVPGQDRGSCLWGSNPRPTAYKAVALPLS